MKTTKRVPGSLLAALATTVTLIGCQNSGEGRVLGIDATGVVVGAIFVDRNGNGVADAGDGVLANVPVRLIAAGTHDTTARTSSIASGAFGMTGVPIGTYVVSVDSALPGDTIRVTQIALPTVNVGPNDTLVVLIGASYPQLSLAAFRALANGKKAFIAGVALNPRNLFGDSTLNMADPGVAIRVENFRSGFVGAGDSIRVLGIRALRGGQPVLDKPVVFTLSTDADLPLHVVTSGAAANAQGGALDAALVRVLSARIADTATVDSGRVLHVNDNSGLVEVMLDSAIGFRGTALAADTVGARFDVNGLLVPIGPSAWRILPRTPSDMVKR